MAQRVRYLERQVLTADDLNQEQAYLLGAHWRHNLANHDWGILQGLYFYNQERELWLARGLAVDGYGRELFVSEPFPIRRELFTMLHSGTESSAELVVDLWLRYARQEDSSPQSERDTCDPEQRLRSLEEARLCVTRPPRDDEGNLILIDPRHPSGVPVDDLDFPPYGEPPDDPGRAWPVYLGRLRMAGDADPTFDENVRLPYANLVGALVRSASRQSAPEDPNAPTAPPPVDRAQVELAPAGSGRPPFAVSCTDAKNLLTRRLWVSSSGRIRSRGHTILVSELTEQERMRLLPEDQEKGNLSTLHMGGQAIRFTQSIIRNPSRLAAKIIAGTLPLQPEAQKKTNDRIQQLFQQPRDTPEQQKKLRASLARLLNNIANEESFLLSSRLRSLRLSRATWDLIRSMPATGEFAPLNARIISELLSNELGGKAMLGIGQAVEVAPLGLPETAQAMPWSLYRIEKQDENGAVSSELRFESFDPGDKDDPTLYQFAIGKYVEGQEQQAFVPCLSVDAGCNVTIRGILRVEGELIQSPVQADPNDPRFLDQLVKGWDQGASAALDAARAASTSLRAEIETITVVPNAASWSYELVIDNLSQTKITNISVVDTFAVDGKVGPTRERKRLDSLAAETFEKVTIEHNTSLPPSGRVDIIVSVQGRLPSGITAYATAQDNAVIVPPVN